MTIESKYVWMDGKMVPFEDANVHMLSHTLHYSLGAFEGVASLIVKAMVAVESLN